MLKSFQQDADIELIDAKEYTLFKEEKEIYFRIGKTKTSKFLVIQAQYENNKSNDFFQTKLTLNNLKEKSSKFTKMKKLEESYVIFVDLFEAKKVHVKDIINKNHLKLVFELEEKNLEINLPFKNFENKILLRKAQTQSEFSAHRKKIDINININEKLNLEDIYQIDEFTENKDEQQNNNEINQKQEDEIKTNTDDNNIKELQNDEKKIGTGENEDNKEEKNSEKVEINKSENENENVGEENKNSEENNSENKNVEDNTIEQNKAEADENKNNNIEENKKDNIIDINNEKNNDNANAIDNKNDDNNNIIKSDDVVDNNENKINEKEEVKIEGDKNNENYIQNEDINRIGNGNADNSININELLEKIKKLENENINLKEKNKKLEEEKNQLNEKLSSEIKFKDEKLKKSEKEKESLKMEIQKLKNVLKRNNIILRHSPIRKKKPSEENKLMPKKTIDEISSQQSSSLAERMKIFQPKESQNQIKKESQIKTEKESVNKIENNNKINIETKKEVNQNKINVESKPPINLKVYKTLTQSSYITSSVDNTFDVFTSLNNEILLVYATKFKSIEFFDIVKQKYHKTILNAHNGQILTIRHYCPKNINKDMILSGSNGDYSVKIWDLETFTCICNINKIYQKGNMYSVCVLFDVYQKESYVYTSCDKDYIKIFNFDGKFKKNIIKTNLNETYFIDTYYDKRDFKYYLITGDIKSVKSYDVNTDQIFRNYSDSTSLCEHVSAFVYKSGDTVKLVECEFYGSIRIWSFHTGNLIKKIDICRRIPLVSMCLWNENYLLVSCVDYTIKLVDFKNYALIKSLEGHNNEVGTIKKIIHPEFGECLLSQGFGNEQIKMWINN